MVTSTPNLRRATAASSGRKMKKNHAVAAPLKASQNGTVVMECITIGQAPWNSCASSAIVSSDPCARLDISSWPLMRMV